MSEPAPFEEAIRRRAHEIWLRRAGKPGSATEDWLEAERELRTEALAKKPAPPPIAAPSPAKPAPGSAPKPASAPSAEKGARDGRASPKGRGKGKKK
jgi:hypothetical protein